MSTPEERLAALLHDTDIPVRGDGFSKIQARVARRRRTRWIVPVSALATSGVAAAVLVVAGPAGRDTQTLQPGETPSATVEGSAFPRPSTCPSPSAGEQLCSLNSTPSPAASSYDGPFLWPAPQTSLDRQTWRSDPQEVAQRFVTDFLRLDGIRIVIATAGWPTQGKEALLSVGSTAVSNLHLERVDGGWVVTQAVGNGGRITAPGFAQSVTSPLDVRGTLDQGVDDNVLLTLRTQAGKQLAQTSAPAGSEAPWSGTLTWSDTSWTHGAVVGITRSNKDGAVTRVLAQPVVRATAPQGATFVGIVDGHVSAFAADGSVGRQLTYPPAGSADVEASFNGTSTLVVRRTPNRGECSSRLLRIDGTTARNVVEPGSENLSSPRLSPSGTWEAWVTRSCYSGTSKVAVREGNEPVRLLPAPDGQAATVEGVRDDGSLLVRVGTTGAYAHRFLSPTSISATSGTALSAGSGCELSAPAFDGPRIVAWEACGSTVRLVRYDGNGARVSTDPAVPLGDAPVRTSVNDGRILVWLFGGDTLGEIARYKDGTLTSVVRNTGCTSVSEPKGCVREPSW